MNPKVNSLRMREMKKIFCIFLGLWLMSGVCAQSQLADSLGDYEARFTKLSRSYSKSPNDVETLYNLAAFYFDNSHPMRNLPMAMKYIQETEVQHVRLIEADKTGELGRLVRSGITLTTIRQMKQAITDAAYHTLEVRADMTGTELDSYMDAFGLDMSMVRLLRQRRINQVYDECMAKGTPEAYYVFINNYAGTREAEEMERRLSRFAPGLFEDMDDENAVDSVASAYALSPSVQRAADRWRSRKAFADASVRDDVEGYNSFLRRFPSSDESDQARERLDKLLEVSFAGCRTAMDFGRFATTYSDIPLAEKALERMRALIYETRDAVAARYYLDHFKLDASYNEVFNRYYAWHAAEGNADPIRRFAQERPDYPLQRVVESDLERGATIDRMGLMADYLEIEYPIYSDRVRRFMGKGIAFVALQRMIQNYVTMHNYGAALDRVRHFDLCFESTSNKEYRELQRVLSEPGKGRRATRELAATYHVTHPVVNEADGRLYFTRAAGASRRVCYAERSGGSWKTVGDVAFDESVENEGLTLYSFYDGGNRMVLGQGGNIMMAERDGDSWRVTDIPPYPVNSDYLETDAYMLPDGSGMLLASDRPGGQNLQTSGAYFHGDTAVATDLYFIPYSNGIWGAAVNLGVTVNTPFSERAPILSRNLKTLYFVTDGRGTLGYSDIYEATRTDLGNWTSWTTPVNVGREINTGYTETDLSFGPDEKRIYYAVNSGIDPFTCYSFATWHNATNTYYPYSLEILGMENASIRLRVADLTTQSLTQIIDCSGESHSVNVNIHKEKSYAFIADAGIYFAPAVIVEPGDKRSQRLRGFTMPVLIDMDKAMALAAVAFKGQTAELLPVGMMQLDQLARFMLAHPDAIVEFCVDVAGSNDELAYAISLERARVLRTYMIRQGVGAEQVVTSPYGNVNMKRGGRSMVSVRFRE